MRRFLLLCFAFTSACGDDSPDFCGDLRRIDGPSGSYCACPEGTTETEEGCLLPDGGVLPLPVPARDGGVSPDGSMPMPGMTPIVPVADLEGDWTLTETIVARAGTTANLGDLGHDPLEGAEGHAAMRVRFERTERALIGRRATGPEGEGETVLVIPVLEHLDAREADDGWVIDDLRREWEEHSHVRLDFEAVESEMRFGSVQGQLRSALLASSAGLPADPTPVLRRFDCPGPETDGCSELEAAEVGVFPSGALVGIAVLRRAVVDECGVEGCEGEIWIRSVLSRRSDQIEYLPAPARELPGAELETVALGAVDSAFPETDPRHGGSPVIIRHDHSSRWLVRDDAGALVLEDGAPVPIAPMERSPRTIRWTLDSSTPSHLIRPAMETVAHWNEGLVHAWRSARGEALPRYPEIACQRQDPDGHCFCVDGSGGEPLVATCAGRYEPAVSPADAASAGVEAPVDCHIELPGGAEPGLDGAIDDGSFDGWREARMVGSECYLQLGLSDPSADPAYLGEGDPRVFSIRVDPEATHVAFADVSGDPVTGRAVGASVRLGTARLAALGDLADRWRRLFRGETVTGAEDVDLPGLVTPPTVAAPALHAGELANADARDAVAIRLSAAVEAGGETEGIDERALAAVRRRMLEDTDFEDELVAGDDGAYFANVERLPDATDSLRRAGSPIRTPVGEELAGWRGERLEALDRGRLLADGSDAWDPTLAVAAEATSASGFRVLAERRIARRALLWALGRALGLRPNLGASADEANHPAERWNITDAIPLPTAPDLTDRLASLEPHRRAHDAALIERDAAGLAASASASVLDSPRALVLGAGGLGPYDRHAMSHAAFGLGELWDDSVDPAGSERPALGAERVNSANTRRAAVRMFPGGQSCGSDSDCPWSASGSRADELTAANVDAGIMQSCDAGVCTAASDLSPAGAWLPVRHRSCDLDEAGDEVGPWCAPFDQGVGAREVLRNAALRYEQTWIVRTHRLGRSAMTPSMHRSELLRLADPALRVVRPVFEGGDPAAGFGGEPTLLATADLVNLLARVIAGPMAARVGDSGFSAGRLESLTDGEVTLPLGLHRPAANEYDDGLQRVGHLHEARFAAELLASRSLFGGRASGLRDALPKEVDFALQGSLDDMRTDSVVGPWLDCTEGTCDTSWALQNDLFEGYCGEGFVIEQCLPSRTRRTELTPLYTPIESLSRWSTLLASAQLAREGDTSSDPRWTVCDVLADACPSPPPDWVEGLEYSTVAVPFRLETVFIGFGRFGDDIERSAGAHRVLDASFLYFLTLALRDYAGLSTPGDPEPSIDFLTPEEQAQLASIGFELPPAAEAVDRANDMFDIFMAAANELLFASRISSHLGTIRTTADFLEVNTAPGSCEVEGAWCRTDDGHLGLCGSGACFQFQP